MGITRKQIKNGSFLGACKIVRLLGRGSMGETYEAQDVLLGRHAVVKVVSPFIEEAKEISSRFALTGQALAKINHQNIPAIYSLKESDGVHYIVMEFVEGRSLKDLIRTETRIAPSAVIHYFRQVMEGLKCLHEAGILHQDIKPKNMIARNDNFVKLVDFGVDRLEGQQVVGTIYYLAPEIIEGERGSVQTDIYSLGISMYECLTGEKPFLAEDWAEVVRRITNEPLSFPEAGPEIPDGLKQIISKMCEKLPIDRYVTVAEALEDLKALEKAEPAHIPRVAAVLPETTNAFLTSASVNTSITTSLPPTVRRDEASYTKTTNSGFGSFHAAPPKKRSGLIPALFVIAGSIVGGVIYLKKQPVADEAKLASTQAPVSLDSPSEGQKIQLTGSENVKFIWSQPPRGGVYIEVARDANFKDRILREAYRSNPYSPTTQLKDGKYYWRLVDQSSSPKKNLIEPTEFTVVTDAPPKIMFPANQHVVQEVKPVQFYWLHKAGVDTYRFQISTKSSFDNILNDIIVPGIQTEALSLAPGDYYWRVRAEDPDIGTSVWSEVRSLRIAGSVLAEKKPEPIPSVAASVAPSVAAPAKSLAPPVAARPASVVSEKQKPLAKKAAIPPKPLKVAKKDAAVKAKKEKEKPKKTIVKAKTEKLEILPPPKLKQRKTAAAQNPVEQEQAAAELLPGPKLKMPPNGVSIVSLNGTQDPVSFRWENKGEGSTYRLQLSKNANFTPLISNVVSKENQFVISKPLPEGQVYWRVRVESPETSEWSASYTLDVSK